MSPVCWSGWRRLWRWRNGGKRVFHMGVKQRVPSRECPDAAPGRSASGRATWRHAGRRERSRVGVSRDGRESSVADVSSRPTILGAARCAASVAEGRTCGALLRRAVAPACLGEGRVLRSGMSQGPVSGTCRCPLVWLEGFVRGWRRPKHRVGTLSWLRDWRLDLCQRVWERRRTADAGESLVPAAGTNGGTPEPGLAS